MPRLPPRAGIAQYYKLLRLCVLAGLIGFTIISLGVHKYNFMGVDLQTLTSFYLLFFLLSCMFITGERFLLRYLESFGFRRMLIKNRANDKVVQKAMVYGGGLFCRLYLTNIYSGTLSNKMIDVCGIIDDDFALHHLSVYGFKVRGGIKDLEKIYAKISQKKENRFFWISLRRKILPFSGSPAAKWTSLRLLIKNDVTFFSCRILSFKRWKTC